MIEKFARIIDKNLPNYAIGYTKNVTKIWCVFFVINASISCYTGVFSSMEIWTIYNGIVAYMLIGLLFTVEYIVRYFFIKKYEKINAK